MYNTLLYLEMRGSNAGKSPGFDNIGPKLLKQVSHVVVDPLLYMYNLLFEMGIVPEKLKIGKIEPIFKGGDSALYLVIIDLYLS